MAQLTRPSCLYGASDVQKDPMKHAILLVAFGASSPQGQNALKGFDALVRQRYPGVTVRWAYTSVLLRERMAQARQKSDSVFKAVCRLGLEHFEAVAVQPLQTIPGQEHGEVRAAPALPCGAPLLASADDVRATAQALVRHLPADRAADENVVFMGHGAEHEAVARYVDLSDAVHKLDSRVHVGAMNGAVTLESILPNLVSHRVWLMPLLSVVGRHALEDMAGENGHSWRSRIVAHGHQCRPVLMGTAEYAGVAEIWLRHLEDAVQSLAAGWEKR